VSRFWSVFFLLLPLVGVGIFAAAPYLGWYFPENVSTLGRKIDEMYLVLLGITGAVFIATQVFLFYILFKFRDRGGDRKASYVHGSRKLETVWTLATAGVIAAIAVYQMPTWLGMITPAPSDARPVARVVARRFEWRIVHAGPDGKLDTRDDVILANELHVPPRENLTLELQSKDVIHSFFLPQFRLKQDCVPGMRIPFRFDAQKTTLAYRDGHADLRPADFEDFGALALAIKNATGAAEKHLQSKLAPETISLLASFDGKTQPGGALEASLLADLNRSLAADDYASLAAFAGVKPSEATLADRKSAGKEKYRRLENRDLLADAFPKAVRRAAQDYEIVCAELCGEGHYQMQGRLIVHESAEDYAAWLAAAVRRQEASP
jgi:cytochrome c oxidase subunit 2